MAQQSVHAEVEPMRIFGIPHVVNARDVRTGEVFALGMCGGCGCATPGLTMVTHPRPTIAAPRQRPPLVLPNITIPNRLAAVGLLHSAPALCLDKRAFRPGIIAERHSWLAEQTLRTDRHVRTQLEGFAVTTTDPRPEPRYRSLRAAARHYGVDPAHHHLRDQQAQHSGLGVHAALLPHRPQRAGQGAAGEVGGRLTAGLRSLHGR